MAELTGKAKEAYDTGFRNARYVNGWHASEFPKELLDVYTQGYEDGREVAKNEDMIMWLGSDHKMYMKTVPSDSKEAQEAEDWDE